MTGPIPTEQLEEILRRTDAVATIGQYLTLRRSGKSFKGVCPFHPDKDPSLTVNPERGLWYCFGCGQGGDLFRFLMKIENLSFAEVARILAEKAGLRLHLSPVEQKVLTEREHLQRIVEAAARFYHEQIFTPQGRPALEYLQRRGIRPEAIRDFLLGYAPPGGRELLAFLASDKLSAADAVKAGIATTRSASGEPVDYFRGRITFPIFDSMGRGSGMGGRVMDESQPKYLHTTETPIFVKGRTLYGLYRSKSTISREDVALVVEGYLDMISLYQGGVRNVVASLGTSLTAEQAHLLSRFCRNCILAYDADSAGRAATARGLTIFEAAGLNPSVMVIPPGEDPDSLIRKRGATAFSELMNKAHSLIDYKLHTLAQKYDLSTPEGKGDFVKEIIPILSGIRDVVRRDEYVRRAARIAGVREETLRRASRGDKSVHVQSGRKKSDFISTGPEEKLLCMLLRYPEAIPKVKGKIEEESLTEVSLRPIFDVVLSLPERDKPFSVADLAPFVQEEGIMSRLTELMMKKDLPPYSEAELLDLVKRINDRLLRQRMEELRLLVAQGKIDHQDPRFQEYQQLCSYFKG